MYLLIEHVVLQLKNRTSCFAFRIFTCIFRENRKKIFSMSYHLHEVFLPRQFSWCAFCHLNEANPVGRAHISIFRNLLPSPCYENKQVSWLQHVKCAFFGFVLSWPIQSDLAHPLPYSTPILLTGHQGTIKIMYSVFFKYLTNTYTFQLYSHLGSEVLFDHSNRHHSHN